MKKLYNSPEVEIVKFAAMQAIAADDPVSQTDDIFDYIPEGSIED